LLHLCSGSLFDSNVPWDMKVLPSLLNVYHEIIPGVNTPMLYWGQWKTVFAW
jgi:hypothetical protein